VEGTPAHHLAIVGKDADLQLWIQKDGAALPIKAVVTYKTAPMAPQYEAVLMDWKLGEAIPGDRFEPVLPEGAQEIEFLPAEGRR